MRTARQSRAVLRPMLLGSVACTSIVAAFIHPARAQVTDINTGLPTAQAVHPLAASPSVGGVTLDMISVAGSGLGRGLVVDSSGSQVGYLARRLRSSTKTDTPLIDTPQAISVVTEAQIRDQNVQSIGEALRYVPGVAIAQGEGHRDEILIRGQRTTADFFVNGIRDDARYFRDLYNTQRIEVLKGPNAMIFGRGGGGGVVNRVLKEADGVPIREVLVQGGQFGNKRMAVDLGDRISDTAFFRLTGVFEDTGTYRDFIDIRRYGVNPTMTFLLGPQTTLRLSYEYFSDNRIADRGIPSQFGRPWRYRENTSTLFGAPLISNGFVDAHIGNAQLDHVFENGVVMRSQTRIADYAKYHQNAYPNSPVSADETAFVMRGYGSQTDRTNYFNQTDFTYKFNTGPLAHTVVAGLELGFQEGIDFRRDFIWNSTGTRNLPVNPFAPTTTEGATLRNLASGRNNTYRLGVFSAFAQDQIEIDEHLQFIVGARFDRFDFQSRDRRPDAATGLPAQPNSRIDNLVSPRVGVVVKPLPNLAFYGSYSVSFLPSAGDQFRVLDPTTALSAPERFENAEIGVKYEITPALILTAALFNLDRDNQPIPSSTEAGFSAGPGKTNTRGAEIGIAGYATDWWQISGGYAYTEPRIVADIDDDGDVIRAGNLVGGVPLNTFSLWNKFDIGERFSVGVGYLYQDASFASSDNAVRLPSFSRFDAGVFYAFSESMRAQVNIENLFDRRYVISAHNNNNNILPGAPRTVRFQIIARF
ncbi:TonB-dependent receptor [Methylorubrum extorquens]|uniref:TonB-dependent siderophore receptor n=1 Tax=Methylorubrum extorquens (strain CM4 / NCIMB 13688) TaxID=440085 RepID=B7KN54_METC4|nr:TonB-dependent siderophore receptor [Methylorubrum extorquens]ACK85171.1 TonB-dependent siderophore receptor [Methylorubrum extorquens CM4]